MYQSFDFKLPDGYQNNNPNSLSRITDDLKSGKPFHYLIIGKVGTGKTMLATEIYNQFRKNNPDVKAGYLKAREVYQEYLNAIGSKFSDKTSAVRKKMQCFRSEISVLDDLGAEKPRTESSRMYMESILEDRYEWIKKFSCCTIITTNLSGEDMGELYGHRVLSRLHEVFTVMKFKDHDFRQDSTEIIEG